MPILVAHTEVQFHSFNISKLVKYPANKLIVCLTWLNSKSHVNFFLSKLFHCYLQSFQWKSFDKKNNKWLTV